MESDSRTDQDWLPGLDDIDNKKNYKSIPSASMNPLTNYKAYDIFIEN